MRHAIARLACGALLVAGRASVHAAPPEADRLFEAGRELAQRGDYAAACEKFAASYALDPALGTELNLAVCDEHVDHLRDAWELYLAAAVQAERGHQTKRAALARERADAVAARLGTIVLDVAEPRPAGLALTVNGRPVAVQREIRDRVDPGDVAIVATAPGMPAFASTVRVAAGQTVIVAIPGIDAPTPAPAPAPRPRGTHTARGRIQLVWGLGAGAGAAAIASLALGGVARSDYNGAANGDRCSHGSAGLVCDGVGAAAIHHAQTLADLSTAFAIGAIAAGAASAVVYFTAPREPIVPIVAPHAIGLAWARAF